MYFYYTRHIWNRIRLRKLSQRKIEEAVTHPEHTQKGPKGEHLAQRSFRGKILEVVYKEEEERMILITAYWID